MFVNGHGGNNVPGQQAVFELRQRHRQREDLLLLFATYWLLGGKPHEVDTSIAQKRMGHACEWETSMMLRLAPHLVGDLKKVEPVEFGVPFEPALARLGHAGPQQGRATSATRAPPRPRRARRCSARSPKMSCRLLERVVRWDGKSWSG